MTADPLGLALGELRKAVGIAEVKESHERTKWFQAAMNEFEEFLKITPGPFIMNDFRRFAQALLAEPSHPNVWGALANTAARKGWIRHTGRMIKPYIPESHASIVMEWIRI